MVDWTFVGHCSWQRSVDYVIAIDRQSKFPATVSDTPTSTADEGEAADAVSLFLIRTLTMPSSEPVFSTPLTMLFKINHPIMLAGMSSRRFMFHTTVVPDETLQE